MLVFCTPQCRIDHRHAFVSQRLGHPGQFLQRGLVNGTALRMVTPVVQTGTLRDRMVQHVANFAAALFRIFRGREQDGVDHMDHAIASLDIRRHNLGFIDGESPVVSDHDRLTLQRLCFPCLRRRDRVDPTCEHVVLEN